MRRSIFLSVVALFLAGAVHATTESDIQFPIAELGGCKSEDACFAYCEEPAHFEACYAFGTTNGLIEEEIDPEMIEAIAEGQGPGGCTSPVSCDAYCSDSNHIVECISFAEKNGLMNDEELAEAKQVVVAIESGTSLPGGCTNKNACEAYCDDTNHIEECIAFAEAAGFISGEELTEAKKMMKLMKEGAMPGGCTSQESCDVYCQDESHFEECIDFSVKTGFMTQEEAEQIKAGGKMPTGPGGCEGEEECNAYCEDPSHMQECIQFSVDQGFMTEEEAQQLIEQASQQPEEFGEGEFPGEFGEENFENLDDDFSTPEGCSTPEECMQWYETSPEDIEEFDKEEWKEIPPQFEVEPESLFVTPHEINAPAPTIDSVQ